MSRVVNVVFKDGGKPYAFEVGELELQSGDQVIVETARGLTVGRVVSLPDDQGTGGADLRRVVRVAHADDLRRMEENREFEREARQIAADMIAESGLSMKVVSVESSFDQAKILISFSAEQRVDFRQLVSRLSERLNRRVELRQVSARDEARLIGGYGSCGRRLCCTLFAGDQDPVSIRMAKDQNLPLNPSKISGVCGRLMCCLKYEREIYTSFRQRAPKKGRMIDTPAGEGRVIELLPTRDSVSVDLGEGRRATFSLDELQPAPREEAPEAPETAARAEQPEPATPAEQPEAEQPTQPELEGAAEPDKAPAPGEAPEPDKAAEPGEAPAPPSEANEREGEG